MKKDELIKLIENLEIEEVNGFSINYFSESKPYGHDDRSFRNINYNFDIQQELNNIRRNIDMAYENTRRDMNYIIEEKLKERGNN